MTDLEKLRAIVDRLETSDRPRVEWMAIMFHAWSVLKKGRWNG